VKLRKRSLPHYKNLRRELYDFLCQKNSTEFMKADRDIYQDREFWNNFFLFKFGSKPKSDVYEIVTSSFSTWNIKEKRKLITTKTHVELLSDSRWEDIFTGSNAFLAQRSAVDLVKYIQTRGDRRVRKAA